MIEQLNIDANKVQGAARQQTKEFNIRKFVADLKQDKAELAREDAIQEIVHNAVDHVLRALGTSRARAKNLGPLLAFVDYGVANNYRALETKDTATEPAEERDVEAAETAGEPDDTFESEAATTFDQVPPIDPLPRKKAEPLVFSEEQIAEQMVVEQKNSLLRIILPSGRTLFDSTREEIMAYRGNLSALTRRLKPGQTPRQAGITAL